MLGVQQSVLLLEPPGLVLIRDAPGLGEGVPAVGGNAADLTVISLRYRRLVELPKVGAKEHESVRGTGRVSILALAPAAALLGMEIRRGELALIGKSGQGLDGLWRERLVVGYLRGGHRVFDRRWLSVAKVEVIETTGNALFQSCDQKNSGQRQCSTKRSTKTDNRARCWRRAFSIFVRSSSLGMWCEVASVEGIKKKRGG